LVVAFDELVDEGGLFGARGPRKSSRDKKKEKSEQGCALWEEDGVERFDGVIVGVFPGASSTIGRSEGGKSVERRVQQQQQQQQRLGSPTKGKCPRDVRRYYRLTDKQIS
jgi:hypothetical protein